MFFGSGRLPQDLLRSEFWKNSQNEQAKSFQICSLNEQDNINESNYKLKLGYLEPISLLLRFICALNNQRA
ncbi:MAG: hypothetical protein CMQ54_03815 [Gammaproteobacteria bacterium]|nr:hypothetical protein [Gammaproteobacteria bacterium]